jgi:hypothetical protein
MRKAENPCAGIALPLLIPRIAFTIQLLHIDLATEPFDAKGYDGFPVRPVVWKGPRLD